jgi:hypothetical protein
VWRGDQVGGGYLPCVLKVTDLTGGDAQLLESIRTARDKVIEQGNPGPFVVRITEAHAETFARIERHLPADVRVEVVRETSRPIARIGGAGFHAALAGLMAVAASSTTAAMSATDFARSILSTPGSGPRRRSSPKVRRVYPGKPAPTNGAREVARRLRQAERKAAKDGRR